MACKSHAGGGDDDAEKRACAQPERAAIEVEVEATGGVNVQLGDRISRGQALGLAPAFSGPVVSPADGVVAAIGFNPTTHRFEISIRVLEQAPDGTTGAPAEEHENPRG